MADHSLVAAVHGTGPARTAGGVRAARQFVGRRLWAVLFIAPALIPFLLVMILPSVEGAAYAFTNWTGIGARKVFTGLTNFRLLFASREAMNALGHTLLLAAVVTVGENVIGLLLALALNTRIKSQRVLRVIFFVPVIVTPVIVANLWGFIYQLDGPLNTLLRAVGLGALAHVWLGDQGTALWAISLIVIWQFAGYMMVIYLAGLQGVPEEVVEAARIDGASSGRIFFSIKLHFLRPALTIALVMATLAGLKTFDQVWALTQGGPGTSTQTISTFMYKNAFVLGKYGFAIADALLLTAITMAFAVLQVRLLSRKGAAE